VFPGVLREADSHGKPRLVLEVGFVTPAISETCGFACDLNLGKLEEEISRFSLGTATVANISRLDLSVAAMG